MKNFFPFILLLVTTSLTQAAYVATFDDLPYTNNADHENGANLSNSFTSDGVQFSNTYFPSYDGWAGFSYSRATDTTTPGYTNQYSAITAAGVNASASYAVAYVDGFDPVTAILPSNATGVTGLYLTNTTYVYLAIVNGDDGYGSVRQFGTNPPAHVAGNQGFPDLFTITITGADASGNPTGSVTVPLADYTATNNADDYALNSWTWVDLTSLSPATHTLSFSLASSDIGAYGINTPTYFAIDNLTYVPEPASLTLLALGALTLRRRSQ